MSQIPFRVDLKNSKGFPFLSELLGRTVLIPQLDEQVPIRALTGDVDGNLASPEIYYCHNVIPTSAGYESVGYRTLNAAPVDTDNTFNNVLTIRDSSGNKAYIASTSSGRNYILKDYLSGWLRTTDVACSPAGSLVTTAYVNGISYIFFQGTGCYTYDFATNVLNAVVLTGIAAANVTGITTSSGYLIAFGSLGVVWSSNISATDFTPSIITGAGGGSVQDLKGIITTVRPYKYGIIIASQYNLVAGVYSGNVRYPFQMKEIVGSGGISDARYIDQDPVSGDNYAWTTSGLQMVTTQVTNAVFPELTDFIAGSVFEDFDETTQTFTQQYLSAPMVKKVTQIADRYIIFSYGVSGLTHAIVYDTALKRTGKLKINHVDCFDYLLLGTSAVDTPRNCLGFLQADGTVVLCAMGYDVPFSYGVMLVGKFQVNRANTCNLVSIDLENIRADSNFKCIDMYSYDGKVTQSVTGYLNHQGGTSRQYLFRQPGMNHSILMYGGFNLSSMQMKMTTGGYR